MNEPIISVSGLRGIIGTQFTPLVAVRYVAALASTLPARGLVVIGRDGRSSGAMLVQAVSSALLASGYDVADLGCISTPTVGVQVRSLNAVAGIQISASHNPKEYNGLKLFGPDGRVLPKTAGEKVLAAYRAGQARWVDVDAVGQSIVINDPLAKHHATILKTIDVEAICSKRFRVLLDSNHGAGGALGRRLLESLGCQVTVLGESPTGQFWHTPEPLAANLAEVCVQSKLGGYDVTFCQDPDADRLAIIDENGHFIGEELTLALCLLDALPNNPGPVTVNCATSSVSRYAAEQCHCPVFQAAVGEANVCDDMLARNAVFGGEGNGGPIDPTVGYVRDSFVGMARVLSLLAKRDQRLSSIVQSLPPLAMIKDKATLRSDQLPKLFQLLQANITNATFNTLDGLKIEWPDRWLLVRGSNTEPIVRFIAEAPSTAEAQTLCDLAQSYTAKL